MRTLMFYLFYGLAMKIYHQDKDYEKAREFYEKAAKFLPNHAKNQFKIGMCYYKVRDYNNASVFLEKASELDPENEHYQEQLQTAKNRSFSIFAPTKLWWHEIVTLEQEIAQKGASYTLLVNLAEDCLAMRHYDKAANAYKQAIAMCHIPENLSQLYYALGYAYENVADEKSLESAKEAYRQAIHLDEELESKRYGIGVFHFAKERWRFANLALLEKAHMGGSCTDDLLLKKIGETYEYLYDWANARKFYQQSLELNYQNPQTHFRFGFVCERMGDYGNAASAYVEGLRRNNDLNTYWVYRLGFVRTKLQDFQGAVEAFEGLQTTTANALVVGGGGEFYDDECLEEQRL